MTTDTELHDLLTAEAGGPSAGAGWEDVVRRGRRRQRVRRARGVALGVFAAGAVIAGVSLSSDDPSLETLPPADPPSTTTSSTIGGEVVPTGPLTSARVQGAFLTMILPPADPTTGFDPCADLHPRTPQSSDQIAIELVTGEPRGLPWASCLSSPFSAWGTIELLEPYGGQPVIDLTTGNEVDVVDAASLLFPTELPEAFTPGVWDEFAFEDSWTFSWSAGDLFVNVTTRYGGTGECDRQTIEVRGTTGRLCDNGNGFFDLHWEEDGKTIAVELGASDPEQDSGFTVQDVLTVAEGLEPYDEAGPEALGT